MEREQKVYSSSHLSESKTKKGEKNRAKNSNPNSSMQITRTKKPTKTPFLPKKNEARKQHYN